MSRSPVETAWPSAKRAWAVAIILMLANTMAFVDRQALALLVQPIKQDLGVSDTAMSLLYGMSFTIFYVAVGLPVARLADKANRRKIISLSIFVWSAFTGLCGLARSFPGLFIARVGVGAGEGGLSPAAYSLLSDYFPRHRLPAAMGVYQIGIYLGGALALVIGGMLSTVIPPLSTVTAPVLGSVKGWQVVFLALAAPGIVLSLITLLIREPQRHYAAHEGSSATLGQLLAHLRRRKGAYIGIALGFSLMIFVGNGTAVWIPAFLERKYGLSTAQIGASYGPIVFFCGASGALVGGLFASWLQRLGVARGNLKAALLGFTALVPITIAFPLMPTAPLALLLIGAMNFFAGFNFGGGLAALQDLTPNRMRAMVSAGYLLAINIIGAALGPTAIALVTDHVFHDPQRLPEAISLICAIASPLSVVLLLVGLRGYAQLQAREAALALEPAA